jgi:hypothetical protein
MTLIRACFLVLAILVPASWTIAHADDTAAGGSSGSSSQKKKKGSKKSKSGGDSGDKGSTDK